VYAVCATTLGVAIKAHARPSALSTGGWGAKEVKYVVELHNVLHKTAGAAAKPKWGSGAASTKAPAITGLGLRIDLPGGNVVAYLKSRVLPPLLLAPAAAKQKRAQPTVVNGSLIWNDFSLGPKRRRRFAVKVRLLPAAAPGSTLAFDATVFESSPGASFYCPKPAPETRVRVCLSLGCGFLG
jgi:hypothetical protein